MAGVSTRKHGSTWQYYFEGAKIGNERQRISKGGFKTKKEAEIAGNRAYVEYTDFGQITRNTNMSVHDFISLWFDAYCKSNVKFTTADTYMYNSHIVDNYLGRYRLSAVSSIICQQFYNDISSKYSKSSANVIYSVSNSIFDYAKNMGYIKLNPFERVEVPKYYAKDKKTATIYTREEIEELLKIHSTGKINITLTIAYHTGMRLGEILALTWDDIDLNNKIVHITKQTKRKNKNYIFTSPKRNSSRDIYIDDTFIAYLKQLKQQQDTEKINANYNRYYLASGDIITQQQTDKEIDFVVRSKNGLMVKQECVQQTLYYCAKDGKPIFNHHDIRHSHCTILIENGADIKYVQQRLGHKSVNVTLDIYTHLTQKSKNKNDTMLNHLF